MDKRIKELMKFLDASRSVYHAADYLKNILLGEGYTQLAEGEKWTLVPGGKYFLTRGGTAVMAFRVPQQKARGFLLSASHSDRPTFKVKENAEQVSAYTRLATEKYGGMLMAPWLDRPLSIAGRVLVQTENGVESRLVDIDKDLLLIPNVAIHMNRSVNDGYKWNPAVDTLPLFGGKDAKGKFQKLLKKAAGGEVLGHDLYLYVRQKATVWGVDQEFISSAALDDLECAWCCTQGFLRAEESQSISVLCVFDSEEVGSGSVQGAASKLLETTITRICRALELDEDLMLANSFMLSADNAHALHPNHLEFSDSSNAPVMNGGVVLKFNASLRYTTDGLSAAVFRSVCQKADVPVQTYCNRADVPGGSTLGYISLSHVSIPSADIGLAQLAMHSCYETAGVKDAIYLEDAMAAYYGTTLEVKENQYTLR